jgi:hypothetical protein
MQQFSNDFLRQWEHIIDEVNKTEIPLECIKKVIITLDDKTRQTVNLSTLRKQGLSWEEIESVLSRTLMALEPEVRDIEFVVDVTAVAEIVQPKTNELLKNL